MVYENQTKLMHFEYEKKVFEGSSDEPQSKAQLSKQSLDTEQSSSKKDRFVPELDYMEKEQQKLKLVFKKVEPA